MTERLRYPPVHLGIFVLLMTAVGAALSTMAPPFKSALCTLFWGGVYGAGLYAGRRLEAGKEKLLRQMANGSAMLALVIFLGGIALSGVETGLILLLLTLQAGQNLVLSTRRNLNFACLISLILILYGAGKAMGGYFVALVVLYVLAAIFTFMADHIDNRLSLAHGGDRELLTRRMHLPVKGIGLALLTLCLGLAIYLLVPQPPSPKVQAFPASSSWNYDNRNWEMEAKRQGRDNLENGEEGSDGSTARSRRTHAEASQGNVVDAAEYSGFRSRFDVTGGDEFFVNRDLDLIVLYVQADRPLYARGKVFDTFDGRHWEESTAGVEKRYSRDWKFTFGAKPRQSDTLQVYTVRQDIPPFIFAAYRPVLAAFPGNAIELDADLTLRSPARLRRGTVYSIVSRVAEVDGHPCSNVIEPGEKGQTADGRYLSLYPGVSERMRGLARDVTKGANDDFSRARAVEAYLRENFAYSLDTVSARWSGNPVEQFLFDLKAGHCELFASSMVVLLRTLNIPARLVTGFYVNHYNPVTGYYEVWRSDGHAWVEAYVEPHGWVTFEPTSGFVLPQWKPRLFVATGLVRYAKDRANDLIRKHGDSWWAHLVQKFMLAAYKLWLALKVKLLRVKLECISFCYWFLRGGWRWLLLLLAGGGAEWLLWRCCEPAWRLTRLRRALHGDPQRFPRLCYREMERLCTARGAARSAHVTPLEYEEILIRRFPSLAPQVATITRLFRQAAYGPLPVGTKGAEEALRAFKEMQHLLAQFRFSATGHTSLL
jgi:hypothetical protein